MSFVQFVVFVVKHKETDPMHFLTSSRKRAGISLVVVTILMAVLFVASLLPAMMSPMITDSMGSGGNDSGIWLAFGSAASLPIVILGSIVLSWVLFLFKRYRAALLINLLPVVNVILLFVGFNMAG